MVPAAVPVVDEVHPSSVGLLHPQHELEHAAGPGFDLRRRFAIPYPAQQPQQARRIVHARHPFEPGFARGDGFVAAIGVDRHRERTGTGGRDGPCEACELSQHGSSWARMSSITKSAAARDSSDAP